MFNSIFEMLSIIHTFRWSFVVREFYMALSLSALLGVVGLIRSLTSPHTSLPETLAICVALVLIVFISVVLGSTLPLMLQFIKVDPAHSSTSIQVIMDILGVLITCSVAMSVLYTTGKSSESIPPGSDVVTDLNASVDTEK